MLDSFWDSVPGSCGGMHYIMNELSTEEKLEVIHTWTYRLDVSHDRSWAKIIYNKLGHYEFTPTCMEFSSVVNHAYNMVSDNVWTKVNSTL